MPCPHCGRVIDALARMCVYCNRDPQAPPSPKKVEAAPLPPPPPSASTNAVAATVMPKIRAAEQKVGGKVLGIAAAAMLLMASFAVGGLYYAFSKKSPTVAAEGTPLVVDREQPDVVGLAMPTGAPVVTAVPTGSYTSAPPPAPGMPVPAAAMQAGADATALPSDQYAQIAAQAQRVSNTPTTFQPADPLLVATPPPGGGAPAAQQTVRRPPLPQADRAVSAAERRQPTGQYERARPLSQPLPGFGRVNKAGTVRLSLTIGTSGNVEEVQVLESVSGLTPKVIAAVQRWRFKPATRGGEPVRSQYPVDITFKESY